MEKNHQAEDWYKYQDHSNETDPLEGSHLSVSNIFPIDMTQVGSKQYNVRFQKFPLKLHIILSQPQFDDIISWMPHGRAWKVIDTTRLEKEVLPLCFESANYNSFNRIVNAWSFRRVSSGPDQGAYYHEMFLRGMPHLISSMRRIPRKGKKIPMDHVDEPNFYKMSQMAPLKMMPQNQDKTEYSISSQKKVHERGEKNNQVSSSQIHSPRTVAIHPILGFGSAQSPSDLRSLTPPVSMMSETRSYVMERKQTLDDLASAIASTRLPTGAFDPISFNTASLACPQFNTSLLKQDIPQMPSLLLPTTPNERWTLQMRDELRLLSSFLPISQGIE